MQNLTAALFMAAERKKSKCPSNDMNKISRKLPHGVNVSYHLWHQQSMWESIQGPAVPLPILLPANIPGKWTEDTSSVWASATHMRDPDGVSGSWFMPGPVPAIATIWRLKQQMEACSLSSPPPAFPPSLLPWPLYTCVSTTLSWRLELQLTFLHSAVKRSVY